MSEGMYQSLLGLALMAAFMLFGVWKNTLLELKQANEHIEKIHREGPHRG